MPHPGSDSTQIEGRINELVAILSGGGVRSDCIRHATEQGWGVTTRTVENYIAKARQYIRDDFNIDRPQMAAEMLKRLLKYEKQAEATNQPAVAIQSLITQAKIVGIIGK